MKTKIEKWETKRKILYIICQDREKNEAKYQTTMGDNLTIISCHAPHHMKKDMVEYLW
jgi:hypothetical protein